MIHKKDGAAKIKVPQKATINERMEQQKKRRGRNAADNGFIQRMVSEK